MSNEQPKPWEWPEAEWRRIVGNARAGRSLAPKAWPGGARCCVTLSFDADHETIPLRDADMSPMRISQGQYGNRRGVPRIRALLAKHGLRASFYYPRSRRCCTRRRSARWPTKAMRSASIPGSTRPIPRCRPASSAS